MCRRQVLGLLAQVPCHGEETSTINNMLWSGTSNSTCTAMHNNHQTELQQHCTALQLTTCCGQSNSTALQCTTTIKQNCKILTFSNGFGRVSVVSQYFGDGCLVVGQTSDGIGIEHSPSPSITGKANANRDSAGHHGTTRR
jgi:hypothetical protein